MKSLQRKFDISLLNFLKKNGWTNQVLCLVFFLLCYPVTLFSQTTVYTQFSPEFQLNRVISDKWAGELDINNTFSNTPVQEKVFKTVIQGSALLWAHYFLSPRWKISTNLSYYYNHDSPEIGQYESTEWRLSLQGIYYIHKIGYTLTTRMRAEARFMTNEEDVYEDTYRYRQMLKLVKPINSKVLRQGVFYGVASEELFFRSKYKSSGMHYFDRNMFTIGGGYMITDDLQVELTYANEFAPRDNENLMNNLVTFTFTTNNLFPKIKRKITDLFTQPDEKE